MRKFTALLFVCLIAIPAYGTEFPPADQSEISKAQNTPTTIVGDDGKRFQPPFRTQYDEMVVASYNYSFGLMPTWGVTDWNDITKTGNGGTITDTGGVIRLRTGSNASGTASIQTVEVLEYVPGSMLRGGLDFRGPDPGDLSGGQTYRGGVFSPDNGFSVGADTTGKFIMVEDAGVARKIYQDNWNGDVVDGSGNLDNPSGNKLNFSDGLILNILYNWYGHGDVFFYALVSDTRAEKRENVLLHRERFTGSTNVEDPNLPVTLKADNGGTGDTMDVYLGGRQASRLSGQIDDEQRPTNEFVSDFAITASENTWVPLMACRKKETFPTGSGRINSVRVSSERLAMDVSGGPAQFRVTRSDTTDATFSDPTNWEGESAVECSNNSDSFTAETGNPFIREFISAGTTGSSPGAVSSSERSVVLGRADQTFVVWARKESANDITVSATFFMNEQW